MKFEIIIFLKTMTFIKILSFHKSLLYDSNASIKVGAKNKEETNTHINHKQQQKALY